MAPASGKRRARGFTLIELMVTVIVLAVVAAIALPNMRMLIRSNRLTGQANEMLASLALARTEAIRQNTSPVGNRDVVLCPSANGTSCSANWSDGWIVATRTDDTIDTVIRHVQQTNGIAVAATGAEIVFDNRGRRLVGPNEINITASGCSAGEPYRRLVRLTPAGQFRVEQTTCT